MNKILLALVALLPLMGCAAFGAFGDEVAAIQAETTELLEEVDEKYTAGELDAADRDVLIKEILAESQARLDAAAREAGDSLLGTGNEILDLLIVLLFAGSTGAGALAIGRRMKR